MEQEIQKDSGSAYHEEEDYCGGNNDDGSIFVDFNNQVQSCNIRRVSSCYFSVHSTDTNNNMSQLLPSKDDDDDDEGPVEVLNNIITLETSNNNWSDLNACDILYHDVMMNIFAFLDAKSLCAFSETAHRPNLECFYFLQLQLQRALDSCSREGQQQQPRRAFAAVAGSGCISRLARLNYPMAKEIVQGYCMHSSNNKTNVCNTTKNQQQQQLALLKNGAAALVALAGASAMMHHGDSGSSMGMLLKMGLAGSVLSAGETRVHFVSSIASRIHEAWKTAHYGPTASQPRDGQTAVQQNNSKSLQHDSESVKMQDDVMPLQDKVMLQTMQNPITENDQTGQPMLEKSNHHSGSEHFRNYNPTVGNHVNEVVAAAAAIESIDVVVQAQSSVVNTKGGDEEIMLQSLAMQHPFTANPYKHLPKEILVFNNGDNNEQELLARLASFSQIPTGCVGAYFQTVRRASEALSMEIHKTRQANYDALSVEEQEEISTTFIDACSSDATLDVVKELLLTRQIINVDGFYQGSDGTETCALHVAAFYGAVRVVEFLCQGIHELDCQKDGGLCNIDLQDSNGWTAMHFAAGTNSVQVVKTLAQHGAHLMVEAGNGYTPFHWAQRLSNTEVAQELQRLGADKRFIVVGPKEWPLSLIANRFFTTSTSSSQ